MAIYKKLMVKVREYTDQNGQPKNQWLQIGSIMQSQKGGYFILLDKTFNPAGIQTEPGRTSVMVSMFEPDNKNEKTDAQQAGDLYGDKKFQDDEIPF